MANIIYTNDAIGLYPHLHTPVENSMSGKEEYSITVLIPKEDKATIDKINDATDKLFKSNGWKVGKRLLRDGETDLTEGMAKTNERLMFYSNKMWFRAKSMYQPPVIDKFKAPVEESVLSRSNGGNFRFKLQLNAFEVSGSKGVNCYIQGAMWLGENADILRAYPKDELSPEEFGISTEYHDITDDDTPF